MYEATFGLRRRPFSSVPRTDQYFPAAAIESARQTLIRCIERCEGVGLLVGPSGTGKTLLCQMLAERFQETFQVVLLSSGRLGTRKALLQAILFELGQPYRGMDEGELRLALVDYLTTAERVREGMVLLVDEAHTLPLRLLEEIRVITNLICRGEPCTRLVLSGGGALEERFASPKLESFTQRIAARCYLEAPNRSETEQYIQAQIEMAGGNGPEIFPAASCEAVYRATDGIPRLVNQVCDHALLLACARGTTCVDRNGVEEAWADLQQLPTPWTPDDDAEDPKQVVIEFGGLDDDDEILDDEPEDDGAHCLPMLRVTGGNPDPQQFARTTPDRQVEQIQEALADMDAASEGPPEGESAEPVESMTGGAHGSGTDTATTGPPEQELPDADHPDHDQEDGAPAEGLHEAPADRADWPQTAGAADDESDDQQVEAVESEERHAAWPEARPEAPELPAVGEAPDPFSEPFQEEEEIIVERFGCGPTAQQLTPSTDGHRAEEKSPLLASTDGPDRAEHSVAQLDEGPAEPAVSSAPDAGPEKEAPGLGTADPTPEVTLEPGLMPESVEVDGAQPAAAVVQFEAHAGSLPDETGPLLCQADAAGLPWDIQALGTESAWFAEPPQPAVPDPTPLPDQPVHAEDRCQPLDLWDQEPQTVPFDPPPSPSPPLMNDDDFDDDLIVVEEGYGDPDPTPNPRARVRRQEYRQLFARLRRGERG